MTVCSSHPLLLSLSVRNVYLLTSPLFNQRPAPAQLELPYNWEPSPISLPHLLHPWPRPPGLPG